MNPLEKYLVQIPVMISRLDGTQEYGHRPQNMQFVIEAESYADAYARLAALLEAKVGLSSYQRA